MSFINVPLDIDLIVGNQICAEQQEVDVLVDDTDADDWSIVQITMGPGVWNRGEAGFNTLRELVENQCSGEIGAKISDERGVSLFRDPNWQHRLGYRQLGLGRVA